MSATIIRAALIGSDSCAANGITARGHSPVFSLCRQLLAAGMDPDQVLEIYRGATLVLRVRSVGEGARLTVAERPSGPTFERWKPFLSPAVSPPMRQNRSPASQVAGDA
jgi:hypothetical protein